MTERKNISILGNAEVCWHHKCQYNWTRLPIALNEVLMCVWRSFRYEYWKRLISHLHFILLGKLKVYKSKLQSIEDIRGRKKTSIQIFIEDEKKKYKRSFTVTCIINQFCIKQKANYSSMSQNLVFWGKPLTHLGSNYSFSGFSHFC